MVAVERSIDNLGKNVLIGRVSEIHKDYSLINLNIVISDKADFESVTSDIINYLADREYNALMGFLFITPSLSSSLKGHLVRFAKRLKAYYPFLGFNRD